MSTPDRSVVFYRIAVVVFIIAVLLTLKPVRRALGVLKVAGQSAAQIAGASANPQYAKKEQELRAKGIPTTLADLDHPLPPASRNAGPLYLVIAVKRAYPKAKDEDAALAIIRSKPATNKDWLSAQTFIDQHNSFIATSEVAARRPECVIKHQPGATGPIGLTFPEYAAMREVVRVLSVKSRLLSRSGKYQQAVDEQALGFNVAKHSDQDMGFIIAKLVKMACDAITLQGMENILQDAHGAPTVAASIDSAIAKNWQLADMAKAYRNETAMGNAEIHDEAIKGPGGRGQPKGLTWNGFIDCNGAEYLRLMEESVDAAGLPYPKSKQRLEAISTEVGRDKSVAHLLSTILYPVGSGSCTKAVDVQAKAAITRAACAVFIYKSKHGAYPLTLADAAPKATDPFDSKLLGYRREGKGFVLYSVGPTGKYDGGDFDKKKQHEEVFRYSN